MVKKADKTPASGHASIEREIKATRGAMRVKRKRRELLLYGVALALFLAFLYYVSRERSDSIEGRVMSPTTGSFQVA